MKDTIVDRRRKLLDKLHWKANDVALRCAADPIFDNSDFKWEDVDLSTGYESIDDWWKVEIISESQVKFHVNQWAFVEIKDIRPTEAFQMEVGDPVLLDEKITDVNTVDITNKSSFPVERTYSYAETIERSTTIDIGVEAGLEIRQLFSYGGDAWGFKGETEFTASISTAYNNSTSNTSTTERDTDTTFTVPPMTKALVANRMSISKYRQSVTIDSDLDYTIRIFSNKGFGKLQDKPQGITFDSFKDWEATLEGYGTANQGLSQFYRKNKWPYYPKRIDYDLSAQIVKEVKFDEAVSGNISITSEAI